jgi:hypothetical protein
MHCSAMTNLLLGRAGELVVTNRERPRSLRFETVVPDGEGAGLFGAERMVSDRERAGILCIDLVRDLESAHDLAHFSQISLGQFEGQDFPLCVSDDLFLDHVIPFGEDRWRHDFVGIFLIQVRCHGERTSMRDKYFGARRNTPYFSRGGWDRFSEH